MSFLKLLRSIPKDGEITPELERKLHKAAVGLLRGQEIGSYDLPDKEHRLVEYENHSGLEALNEPEIIDEENAESEDRSDHILECNYGDNCGHELVLVTLDENDREIPFANGSKRQITQIRKNLDLIRAKRGHKACQNEIRRLREEYLLQTMGDFYEKGV